MKHPLIAPLAAFAAGIWAAQYAAFSIRELALSIGLLLALALVGLARGATRAAAAACLAGFALAGALRASWPVPPDAHRVDRVVEQAASDLRRPVRIEGWVRVPPTVRLDRDQFVLAVESAAGRTARGGVRLTVLHEPGRPPLELHYGDRLELDARLRRLRNFENPGGFDRVTYLRRQDIHMTGSVSRPTAVRRLEGRRGHPFLAAVWHAREWAERRTDLLLGPQSTNAALVKAMVLGDGAYLDRALGAAFQKTGTYHALVVSGSHVGLLAVCCLFVFRRLPVSRDGAALVTMVLLIGFVLLVGAQLPVIRAAIMVGAYLIGRHFYRERRALNLMAAAAWGMLLADPQDLFDASFQLSFLSVALIAGLAAPILERWIEPYRLAAHELSDLERDLHLEPKVAQIRVGWRLAAERLPFPPRWSLGVVRGAVWPLRCTAEILVVSSCIQLGLILPMVVYFHRFSLSGLTANVAVVPLMSWIVPVGFLAILTGWGVLGRLLTALVETLVAVVDWHARLSWLEARAPEPPAWLAGLFAAALVAFAWGLHRRGRHPWVAGTVLLAAAAVLVVHPFPPRLEPGKLELTALDVGQGEALFLALPEGRTMLVDAGGLASFGSPTSRGLDIGEEVVAPYLWSRSIRRLDVVAVSHAHGDHIGGLPALLENFSVGELWIGDNPPSEGWARVVETAGRRRVPLVALRAGAVRSLGGVSFEVLWPPPVYTVENTPSNDDSLVLLGRFGEHRFLLSGDIEWRPERQLLENRRLGRLDLLKVAHHGSRSSTFEAFLDTTRPWLAVISAGSDSPYGHPHPDVLTRLEARHIRVLRTDRDGAVSVTTDGRRVVASTFRAPSRLPPPRPLPALRRVLPE